ANLSPAGNLDWNQRIERLRQVFIKKCEAAVGVEPNENLPIRERVYKVDLYDLLRAYTRQRNQTAVRVHVVRRRVVWSIKDARRRLETMIGRIADADWVQLELCLEEFNPGGEESRTALAASFGASLEMAREGLVDLRQAKPFAPIYLKAAQRSEVSSAFVGDDRATEDEVPEEERAAKDGTS
ncbi:MAG: hypothetical protein AAFR01_14600, partial [Pseudomonadota bacterium]